MDDLAREVIEFLGTLEPVNNEKEEDDINEEKTLETLNFD